MRYRGGGMGSVVTGGFGGVLSCGVVGSMWGGLPLHPQTNLVAVVEVGCRLAELTALNSCS